jgi:hypothetical protein
MVKGRRVPEKRRNFKMDELYFMEYMMENIALFSPIISVLNVLTLVFLVLYMNYTAKYKNHELSVAWYILAFFFPLPVAIAFAVKSKKFRHENTKVCSQCGDKYPETFSMCSRCLIDLPELDDPSRMKKKKLGKIFCGVFWVSMVALIVAVVTLMGIVAKQTMDLVQFDNNFSYRIPVETATGENLYYDREGNVYTDPWEVVIYDKDGKAYTYEIKEVEDEEYGLYEDSFYVDEDGNNYVSYYCYVDENGYFYYDDDEEIYWYDSDCDYDEEYEFDDLFEEQDYRYYYDRYIDKEGNFYYYAEEVSWNEKGEIITAENDPNPPVAEIED